MPESFRRPLIARRPRAPVATLPARIADAVLRLLGEVPDSDRHALDAPRRQADAIARVAASKAALAAGGLALPTGPVGWLTVLPELIAVWRLQAQMVADIAAVHGRDATLSREQMLYCLFRHTAAQGVRDLVVQVGERWLIQRVPAATLQRLARAVGVELSKRALQRGVARWLPVAGAVGVGAYAFFDTRQVAHTAIALFSGLPAEAEQQT